jgi:quercetin dioxygenase-like cupin family protein
MLICTAGEGWYQEEGQPAICLKEGSVLYIPAGKKHWHGATADSWFSHIAFELPGTETRNEWLEPVSDQDFSKL